jgi:hypothetical protein
MRDVAERLPDSLLARQALPFCPYNGPPGEPMIFIRNVHIHGSLTPNAWQSTRRARSLSGLVRLQHPTGITTASVSVPGRATYSSGIPVPRTVHP